METLMVQANSGMYRVHDTYFEACKQKLQKQDSKVSSEWESLDMALWPKESQGSSGNGNESAENPDDDQDNAEEIGKKMAEIVSQDIFIEEGSIDLDDESEWSLDIS